MNPSKKEEKATELRAMLKPGDVIYTKLNHRSASGMQRVIDLYVIRENTPLRITHSACVAMGATYNKRHEGMQINGCGMDAGFYAVYNLGYALWPNGTPEPHGTLNGLPDSSGGYALKQRWL